MGKWRIIIGLGNPHKDYLETYHNVGFLFLDYLNKENSPWESPSNKRFQYLKTGDQILVKPKTFMNESGLAVKQAIDFFSKKSDKISAEDILVIHDDSDISLGEYKLSSDRGSAGHKGIISIVQALKTQKFSRIRIGIRAKLGIKAEEFVLKQINKKDLATLKKTFLKIHSSELEGNSKGN